VLLPLLWLSIRGIKMGTIKVYWTDKNLEHDETFDNCIFDDARMVRKLNKKTYDKIIKLLDKR
jgi:hypothetical protein